VLPRQKGVQAQDRLFFSGASRKETAAQVCALCREVLRSPAESTDRSLLEKGGVVVKVCDDPRVAGFTKVIEALFEARASDEYPVIAERIATVLLYLCDRASEVKQTLTREDVEFLRTLVTESKADSLNDLFIAEARFEDFIRKSLIDLAEAAHIPR